MSLKEIYGFLASVDLLVTSRMHAGITAMGAGVPALFLLPSEDVKVLDILSFLNLEADDFIIDIFNPKTMRAENIQQKFQSMIDNIGDVKQMVDKGIDEKFILLLFLYVVSKTLADSMR